MMFDKAQVRHAFAAASHSYDSVAHLQREVGMALLQAADLATLHGTVLDIGCGTGFLTGHLAQTGCGPLIALDIAFAMLQSTRAKLAAHPQVHYLCADAEAMPLAAASIDQVFSNLALQWCGDLNAVFGDLHRVLQSDGQLHFSTFGPQTLQELKRAWAAVDSYPHVNDFYPQGQLIASLQQAGFRHITCRTHIYQPHYASVLALMRELKGIGAHNVLPGRNKRLTSKTALHRMMAAYPPTPEPSGITATFEVFIVSATR